jgi:hypothetical protein
VRELEARLKESETRLREAGKVNERLGQEATRREILLKRTQLKLQALPQVINCYSLLTVLGSIPASSVTVKSEWRQMKQC